MKFEEAMQLMRKGAVIGLPDEWDKRFYSRPLFINDQGQLTIANNHNYESIHLMSYHIMSNKWALLANSMEEYKQKCREKTGMHDVLETVFKNEI